MKKKTMNKPINVALKAVALVICSSSIVQNVAAQEIIAHQSVPLKSISVPMAKTIFGGRIRNWPNGLPVRVFVYNDRDNRHIKFCKEGIDVFPRELRRAWDRIVFSGLGEGPTTVESQEEMIKLVSTTEGAIGYVINPVGAEEYVIPFE